MGMGIEGAFVTFVGVIIAVVFCAIGFAIVRSIAEAIANSGKAIESSRAQVVTKRTNVSGGGNNTSASTSYYVTFERGNGSREEFCLSGREYGLLAEGDWGTLRTQGTWFKGFDRTKPTGR